MSEPSPARWYARLNEVHGAVAVQKAASDPAGETYTIPPDTGGGDAGGTDGGGVAGEGAEGGGGEGGVGGGVDSNSRFGSDRGGGGGGGSGGGTGFDSGRGGGFGAGAVSAPVWTSHGAVRTSRNAGSERFRAASIARIAVGYIRLQPRPATATLVRFVSPTGTVATATTYPVTPTSSVAGCQVKRTPVRALARTIKWDGAVGLVLSRVDVPSPAAGDAPRTARSATATTATTHLVVLRQLPASRCIRCNEPFNAIGNRFCT
jgi:hypothetical protein